MKKIRFLTENEIKTIAAGEVIERPSSIVKELVENSLDAGSSSIEIEIKNGGKDFICIEDNGFGMEKEDLEISVVPHTTSKFFGINDLSNGNINSYGFRGEALASIASISNLTINTKTNSSDFGYQLKVSAGETISLEKSNSNNGTTIKIENIFDSIPARKKFLKSKETEFNAISNVLIGMGLSSPETRFSLFHNEKSVYQWASVSTIFERAKQILPIHLHEYILECDYQDNYLKIKGIISSIEYGNYDRSNIFILVNKRLIKQYKITQAVVKAYSAELLSHRYPFAYLSIEIDKKEIDINVHPRKEEIAFLHPKKAEESIINAIKSTLNKKLKETFSSINLKKEENFFEEKSNFEEKNLTKGNLYEKDFSENYYIKTSLKKFNAEDIFPESKKNIFENKNLDFKISDSENKYKIKDFKNSNFEFEVENKISDSFSFLQNEKIENLNFKKIQQDLFLEENVLSNKFIGIFSNTYLLFDLNEELLFIDQHALHERIIYESIKNENFENSFQKLLNPIFLKKDRETINFISENENLFKEAGLILNCFDELTVAIKAYSKFIDKIGFEEFFNISLKRIKEFQKVKEIKEDLFRKIKGDISCKRAIRAGDKLNKNEIYNLIEKAALYENIFLCPHGRPTFYKLSKKNIEKMFKRID